MEPTRRFSVGGSVVVIVVVVVTSGDELESQGRRPTVGMMPWGLPCDHSGEMLFLGSRKRNGESGERARERE